MIYSKRFAVALLGLFKSPNKKMRSRQKRQRRFRRSKSVEREKRSGMIKTKKPAELQSIHFPTKARECESREEINDK
jgi:hypothetical protein